MDLAANQSWLANLSSSKSRQAGSCVISCTQISPETLVEVQHLPRGIVLPESPQAAQGARAQAHFLQRPGSHGNGGSDSH